MPGTNKAAASPRSNKQGGVPHAPNGAKGTNAKEQAGQRTWQTDHEAELRRMEGYLLEHLEDACAEMPATPSKDKPTHIPKAVKMQANVFGMIAPSVGRKEMLNHPRAVEAMDMEWNRLRTAGPNKKGAWREDLVENWADVRARLDRLGKAVHIGDISETCTQKHDELPDTPENYNLKKI